jgi:glyoxylase-like metal-dependent hydrolase (beta-lactamase superfamily II)
MALVARSMDPRWLSNTYLVADGPGGHAVLVDGGAPPEPILAQIAQLGLRPTHLLCTHHHHDHVAHNDVYRRRFDVPVCGHAAERELFGRLDLELTDGQLLYSGSLQVRALHIPGHTVGQLAFVLDGQEVYTGDTLFRRSVGGTRGPGHASFADLKRSILDVLLALDPGTIVRPGHTESSTIGEELLHNPFVRAWRGQDPPGSAGCIALGKPATLLLRALDYDGGTKCWVRFEKDGREDVVPGSRVQDL